MVDVVFLRSEPPNRLQPLLAVNYLERSVFVLGEVADRNRNVKQEGLDQTAGLRRCLGRWTIWIPYRGRRGREGRANSKKDLVTGPIRGFCAPHARRVSVKRRLPVPAWASVPSGLARLQDRQPSAPVWPQHEQSSTSCPSSRSRSAYTFRSSSLTIFA